MAKLIIETYNIHGFYKERYVFDHDTITVGRGYDNDLILPDEFVSAQHIKIEPQDNHWLVTDLGSTNGIRLEAEEQPINNALLQSGQEIILGTTRLRLLSPNHSVTPAKPLLRTHVFYKLLSSWWVAIPLLLLYLILASIIDVYTSVEPLSPSDAIISILIIITLLSAIIAFWSTLGRIIKGKAHFIMQLSILCLYLLLLIPLSWITLFIGYNLNNEFFETGLFVILSATLLIPTLTLTLGIATHTRFAYRIALSTGIACGLVIISIFLSTIIDEEFYEATPQFYGTLLPPIFKVAPSLSIPEYLDVIKKSF